MNIKILLLNNNKSFPGIWHAILYSSYLANIIGCEYYKINPKIFENYFDY